ncbi:hypothetical protein ABIB42_001556, partial [Massilia sp. UYP32]|uniref:hypothetical protein n=1 Tax=Massilia sp. UYP32 TaxID=1756386 RepID=UPI003D199791
FLGFLVVITSVMEQSFRDYFMTPFHTEILTGSPCGIVAIWFFQHSRSITDVPMLSQSIKMAAFLQKD